MKRQGPENIVVLRPGALGDVLVCRHLLGWLRNVFPEARVSFVAPGERGKLFGQFGFVDAATDWENAAFSWFFAESAMPPPFLLNNIFTKNTLTIACFDLPQGTERTFKKRFAVFPGRQDVLLLPFRPPDDSGVYIGEWLMRSAAEQCRMPAGSAGAGADFVVDVAAEPEVLVVHPGSGSRRKNWGLSSFAALASLLTAEGAAAGLRRVRIVAGEADGSLGEELAGLLPGAELSTGLSLGGLANVLAAAGMYIGNDSGVTHLAAAVRTRGGHRPKVAAVFGVSDPGIWAAPGTLVLRAGAEMRDLAPEQAFAAIKSAFFPHLA